MDVVEEIFAHIKLFSQESHGSSNYDEDTVFVMGSDEQTFIPLNYLKRKIPQILSAKELFQEGFVFASYDFMDRPNFKDWYEVQFQKKLSLKLSRKISILYRPNHKTIFNALATVHKNYEVLQLENILINSKNLPIQLGEWYAKCIFGLEQIKSTSQRGFDFQLNGQRIEVKVHWNDKTSPKGVKIKKSFVEMCDTCILVYIARNFMIRDLCYLDAEFILRKFTGKGHTIFLKDADISQYFFSRSTKQFDKILNKTALMNFANPTLAMKLDGRI